MGAASDRKSKAFSKGPFLQRVLFVGLGAIGQRHLRNLRELLGNEVEFLAYRVVGKQQILTDRLTVESEEGLEERHQVRSFRRLEEALKAQPEIAVIANPTHLHLPLALRCAQQQCHVFIEKPLSDSLEGARQLIATFEGTGKVGFVGYPLRFHPALRRIRQLIQEQAIGRLLRAHFEVGEYLPGWHPYEDYRNSYASRKDLGGGVILTQSHELDLAIWLFGMPKTIFAVGGNSGTLGLDVEDHASILMGGFKEHSSLPVSLHMDYLQKPPVRSFTAVGHKGRLEWDAIGGSLKLWRSSQAQPQVHRWEGFDRNEMFLDEMRHFLACVEGKEAPLIDVEEGLRALRVALKVKESLETGSAVEIS